MSKDLMNISDNALLLHNINNGNLQLPFENHIYLYTLTAAGIHYYIKDVELILDEDEILSLKREPTNKFDKYAIEIYTKDKIKVGYIPRNNNKIFARLMDGGKDLYAKVKSVDYYFDEIQSISIRIFLRDI